jgi:hypothetical protein
LPHDWPVKVFVVECTFKGFFFIKEKKNRTKKYFSNGVLWLRGLLALILMWSLKYVVQVVVSHLESPQSFWVQEASAVEVLAKVAEVTQNVSVLDPGPYKTLCCTLKLLTIRTVGPPP